MIPELGLHYITYKRVPYELMRILFTSLSNDFSKSKARLVWLQHLSPVLVPRFLFSLSARDHLSPFSFALKNSSRNSFSVENNLHLHRNLAHNFSQRMYQK